MDLSDGIARAAALPASAPGGGWAASLELAYAREGARTHPVLRRHAGPLRVLKGHLPEGPGTWHQVVVHPPGGIAGGDTLDIDVRVQAGAHALLTAPGAAKWYRSAGPEAVQRLRLRVEDGAALEWLPMDTIVFDGARARLELDAEVAPGGTLVACDLVALGRPAAGETFDRGRLRWRTRIHRGGAPVFHEQATLEGGHPMLRSPAGLAGRPLFGTLLALSPRLLDARTGEPALAACREVAEAVPASHRDDTLSCTLMDGLLVARWRGTRADAGLHALRAAWAALRPILLDRPACPPRIWAT